MRNLTPTLWPDAWRMSTRWRRDPRRLMRRSLLRILAVAHDQRLDPAVLISNLAEEHRGANRRLLKRLARRIASGLPLVAALEQTPEVLSDHQVLAIRFGSQSGTLGAAYRDLIIQGERQASTTDRDLWQATVYVIAMGIILICITGFLFAFIFPTMEQMRRYFELDEPTGAYALVIGSYRQLGVWHLLLLAIAIIALPFILASPLGRWLRRRLADSRLRWVQRLRIAELLELLSQSVGAGRPLSGALSTLARYHFDPHVRAQLLFARNEVEQGAEVWDSLRDAKLLSAAESRALADCATPTTRIWLMQSLAEEKRERMIAISEAIAWWLQVLAVLVVAAVVLLVSLAGYQFLTELLYEVG